MTEDEKIQRIIERAIQSAFIEFPDAGNGMMRPKNYNESRMSAGLWQLPSSPLLKHAGYKIRAFVLG
jgi:hypothetical protein